MFQEMRSFVLYYKSSPPARLTDICVKVYVFGLNELVSYYTSRNNLQKASLLFKDFNGIELHDKETPHG